MAICISAFLSVLLCAFIIVGFGQEEQESTHPLIIVSMDGMRWQFIENRYANTPSLDFLAQNGVTSKYLKTVVPSKTWPNHHSYLTGLYPENHGIVSNMFWDPVYQEKFVLVSMKS